MEFGGLPPFKNDFANCSALENNGTSKYASITALAWLSRLRVASFRCKKRVKLLM